MQFTDLPTDIVYHILACLPNFNTLAAAILTSKAHIYSVFETHKLAILTSVAFNLVGPSLPHALATAVGVEQQHVVNVDYDECMDITKDRLMSLSADSRIFLESSIPVMDELEDLFSQMCKDRRSTKSVLTNMESLRFRRALYRMWLLTTCVSLVMTQAAENDLGAGLGTSDEGIYDDAIGYLTARLQQCDKSELVRLVATTNFMRTLQRKAMRRGGFELHMTADMHWPDNVVLSPGDIYHWVVYRERPYMSWHEFTGIDPVDFHRALSAVCPSKQLDSEVTMAAPGKLLLDSVAGEEDPCSRCGSIQGLDLVGRPNWQWLSSCMDYSEVLQAFPGNLGMNAPETTMIRQVFLCKPSMNGRLVTSNLPAVIEALFDFDVPEEQEVWDKEVWYCQDCITTFFKARFPKWWCAKRNAEDLLDKETCWYGWNCRTQTHKPEHARKLNHLCAPVRDDGKSCEEAWGR